MVFKQYGPERSGTNLLRTLLVDNFRDVTVLMHVLGDKHSPPVDLDRLYAECERTGEPAWEFVSRATWAAPALTTHPESESQRAYMHAVAASVLDAYRAGRLGFLVSVKDPYVWAYSITSFNRWYRRRYRVLLPWLFAPWIKPGLETRLRAACRKLNRSLARWLDLRGRYPERTTVVRVEDLARDPRAVLGEIGRRHGLVWRRAE